MKEIKRLENWLTFPEAAKIIGVSKQGFHKMVLENGAIPEDDVRKLGDKPTYIVRTEAVTRLKDARQTIARLNAEMKNVLDDALKG